MPTVYITAPPEAADDLARTLVERRLAACVNRVDCRSIYRWDDEIVDEDEVILLAKTTDDRCDRLIDRTIDLHPYDVPCIERFDAVSILPSYAEWVRDETEPEES